MFIKYGRLGTTKRKIQQQQQPADITDLVYAKDGSEPQINCMHA
jgi:hypothetical protein